MWEALTVAGAASTAVTLALALWTLSTMRHRARQIAHRLAMLPDAIAAPPEYRRLVAAGREKSDNTGWRALVARVLAVDDFYDGQRFSRSQLTAMATMTAGVALLILWRVFLIRLPIAIAGSLLILLACFRFLVGIERRRSELALVASFPDAIDMLVRMVRAGMAVTMAIRTASSDLPPPLGSIFRSITDEYEIGVPLDRVLGMMARRIRCPEFRFFALTVSLQNSTGGSLTTTLENMADMMRRRHAMYLKGRAMVSEVRMSAILLSLLPCISGLALLYSSPGYIASLLYDRRGNLLLLAAALCLLAGAGSMYGMMRRYLRA
jgi:tight adherence protein B